VAGGRARVAVSILDADHSNMAYAIRRAEREGADRFHIDVMDGHFVPNLTIGPLVIEFVKKATSLPLDVHLMIEDAERWVAAYAKAGADLIGVHVEACPHLHRTVHQIRDLGKKPFVVLNPHTPPESIEFVLGDIAQVLVMSVNPGFGGQKFIPAVYPKIRQIRTMLGARGVDVSIDGGVKIEHARPLAEHGASVLVAGSAVFEAQDPAKAIRELRAAAEPGQ